MTNNENSEFSNGLVINEELQKYVTSMLKKQQININRQHLEKILAHFAPPSKIILKGTYHDILGQERITQVAANIDDNNIKEMKKLISHMPNFQFLFKIYITLYELQDSLDDYRTIQRNLIKLLKDKTLPLEFRNELTLMLHKIILESAAPYNSKI
ncbi:hypothetical protein ABN363_19735 [Providencia rettgeri]|uniref:hypothetical protein n=1 Tax=Providencia huaxiensis TaxID=2027290 RepID=UPI0032DD6E46